MAEKTKQFRRRLSSIILLMAIVVLLAVLDRQGVFGRKGNAADMDIYHDQMFTVVNCVDGDTIDIDHPDPLLGTTTTRIRLWGVDTPETVKPKHRVEHFGPEASAFTNAATLNQPVHLKLLKFRTRDMHNRLLAYVFLPDGRCLNLSLIQKGLGYNDPRFKHSEMRVYEQAMDQAKKEKVGLWRDPVPEDWPNYIK